jgi:biofilm PGA synthesis protein PgaA
MRKITSFRRTYAAVAVTVAFSVLAGNAALAQPTGADDSADTVTQGTVIPENDAFKKHVFEEARTGAPGVALEQAHQHSDAFSTQEMLTLEWLLASSEVSWGRQQAQVSQEPDRLNQLQGALTHIDAVLQSIPQGNEYRENRVAMLSLRIEALSGLGRMDEACALYEKLIVVSGPLPASTYAAAGDAYTYRHFQRQAATAYERAMFTPNTPIKPSHTPHVLKLIDVEEGLFFAYLDDGRFEEAQAFLQWLQANTPKHSPLDDDPDELSEDYARVEKMQAQYLVYTSRAHQGSGALDKLHVEAPFDPEVLSARADAAQVEGRVHEANAIYAQMLVDHPGDVEGMTGLGKTELELAQYDRATEMSALFGARFPDTVPVRNFEQQYDAYRSAELIVAVNGQKGNSVLADNDWGIDTQIFSAPIADYWRVFAHQFSGRADTGDGDSIWRIRNGLGGDFRHYGVDASVEADQTTGAQSRTGAAGALSYELDDHWTFSGGFDTNDNTLPWKAYQQGVTGRTLDANAQYQVGDYRTLELGYGISRYSDENLHQQWNASWYERLFSTARNEVSMTVDLDTNSDTLANTAYYAPSRDYTGQVTFKYEWTPWRDGDRSFSQNLYGTVGEYRENDFGDSFLWEVRLEHQWKFASYSTLTYGIGLASQCFDGQRELSKLAYLNLKIPI